MWNLVLLCDGQEQCNSQKGTSGTLIRSVLLSSAEVLEFGTQVADNLPLYGVCCYMDELVHRAPTVLQGSSKLNAPLQRYLVAAPRCYCFLTHYPFFSLHFKVTPLPAV